MKDAAMFKNLVFYLEACESGSMFEGMSIDGVYALSASNPTESSWGTYCGSDAKVGGKSINSCLGDLFSVSWMEDSDTTDTTTESLNDQFSTVKTLTDKSEVMQWGDVSFRSDFVSEYIGSLAADLTLTSTVDPTSSAVSARQVDLHRHFTRYSSAATSTDRLAAGEELMAELSRQLATETAYRRFTELVHPKDEAKREALWTRRSKPDSVDCELDVHRAFRESCADKFDANSGFALQFHQLVVNACAEVAAEGLNADLATFARQACDAKGTLV